MHNLPAHKNRSNHVQEKKWINNKQNSPTTHATNDPIHSTKTFFTNQQEKNLPLLKETRHRKSHKKKPWLYFIKSLKKNHQMNKKTTSNQIRHCTTFPPARTEATTCKKKTESTTKQSHKRTHQKQFSSIKQNFF